MADSLEAGEFTRSLQAIFRDQRDEVLARMKKNQLRHAIARGTEILAEIKAGHDENVGELFGVLMTIKDVIKEGRGASDEERELLDVIELIERAVKAGQYLGGK